MNFGRCRPITKTLLHKKIPTALSGFFCFKLALKIHSKSQSALQKHIIATRFSEINIFIVESFYSKFKSNIIFIINMITRANASIQGGIIPYIGSCFIGSKEFRHVFNTNANINIRR